MNNAENRSAGVSGISLYMPRPRVSLEDWCRWTGNPWDKIQAVVGSGFRYPDINEDAYTMAANAVLRLIRQYAIDPARVGFLALGTESSKDNSAGAVIVRGMLDRALQRLGMPLLARDCEVPEFKHACLGGVYALKNAVRYTRTEGEGRLAIVVAADIAEYERGSTGEQTQGAGAVAMLVEPEARLFEVPLEHCGSASQYRGPDFRKPFRRHLMNGALRHPAAALHDYPVFSGRYSTFAYLDETLRAFRTMARRTGQTLYEVLQASEAIFFHRPYHHMPVQGLAYLWLDSMAREDQGGLEALCDAAGVAPEQVIAELSSDPDLFAQLVEDGEPRDLYPSTSAAAAKLRKTDDFRQFVARKMALGSETAREFGNLYSSSLPAWMAAGLEQAWREGHDLDDRTMLALGYGSGDAAEAMPLRIVPGWETAAARMAVEEAMQGAVNLTQQQYEALHDGYPLQPLDYPRGNEFVITRIGGIHEADFQDLGVDYYEFIEPAPTEVGQEEFDLSTVRMGMSLSG